MNLSDVIGNAIDQDRGRPLDLVDPWEGKPIGVRLWIAGPDSETARKARIALSDDLMAMAGPSGRVSAEDREKARIEALARHVLRWEVMEDGKPVPFSHAAVVRVLRSAMWLQAQVDDFAADRGNFKPEGM